MNNNCQWVDGVFRPCDDFKGRTYQEPYSDTHTANRCIFCEWDITKPKQKKEKKIMVKELSSGLSIKKGEDGHWLNFEHRGLYGSINLENAMKGKSIIKDAVLGWANNQFVSKKPEKPLIVKSGQTYTGYENGINYLCIDPNTFEKFNAIETLIFTDESNLHIWKPFSDIEITDKIAKLRPMVWRTGYKRIEILYGINIYIAIYEYGNGDIEHCRLATAHELEGVE